MKKLLISETFASIQGETTFAGWPCFFIRLSGCNLRCRYCDTRYAWRGGQRLAVKSLAARYKASGIPLAMVTGGEPLLQPGIYDLLKKLVKLGKVLLETNGSCDISKIPKNVHAILDIKCPGSGHAEYNCWANMRLLRPRDEVKFVICNRQDYAWAKAVIAEHELNKRCGAVNFSPANGFLAAPTLAGWILKDRLPVRLNLQLHKIIWTKAGRGR